MIENMCDKWENKYNLDIEKKCTKEELLHLSCCNLEMYSRAYALLEDIEFAIKKKECTDVQEVYDFIVKYIDKTEVDLAINIDSLV